MKVTTTQTQTDFVPYTISIEVQTKQEYEIIHRIFNEHSKSLFERVNDPYVTKIDTDEIKCISDKIYYANQYALAQLYQMDAKPIRAGIPHELDEQITNDTNGSNYANLIVGEYYVCIADVMETYNDKLTGTKSYTKGNIYKSEAPNCLTDDNALIKHWWPQKDFVKYFTEYKGQTPQPIEADEIKIGDVFLCKKDVIQTYCDGKPTGEITYLKGKFYYSEHDCCITDENGNKSHGWRPGETDFKRYFTKQSKLYTT